MATKNIFTKGTVDLTFTMPNENVVLTVDVEGKDATNISYWVEDALNKIQSDKEKKPQTTTQAIVLDMAKKMIMKGVKLPLEIQLILRLMV